MTEDELRQRVNAIIATGDYDDEEAHRAEDELNLDLIDQFCPPWVVREVGRLLAADFCRWFA